MNDANKLRFYNEKRDIPVCEFTSFDANISGLLKSLFMHLDVEGKTVLYLLILVHTKI